MLGRGNWLQSSWFLLIKKLNRLINKLIKLILQIDFCILREAVNLPTS